MRRWCAALGTAAVLTALLAPLGRWRDRLVSDLRRGTCSPPTPLPAGLARRLAPRPCRRRADELGDIFRSPLAPAEQLRRVWPRLALISCWADAASARITHPGVQRQEPAPPRASHDQESRAAILDAARVRGF